VKRIGNIELNHEDNVDGLRLTHEMNGADRKTIKTFTTPCLGRGRGKSLTATIELKEGRDGERDEKITGIRANYRLEARQRSGCRTVASETTRKDTPIRTAFASASLVIERRTSRHPT
jgi:hypothetical protein